MAENSIHSSSQHFCESGVWNIKWFTYFFISGFYKAEIKLSRGPRVLLCGVEGLSHFQAHSGYWVTLAPCLWAGSLSRPWLPAGLPPRHGGRTQGCRLALVGHCLLFIQVEILQFSLEPCQSPKQWVAPGDPGLKPIPLPKNFNTDTVVLNSHRWLILRSGTSADN